MRKTVRMNEPEFALNLHLQVDRLNLGLERDECCCRSNVGWKFVINTGCYERKGSLFKFGVGLWNEQWI